MTCLFCDIVAGKISARIVRSNDDFVAFHDINPQAPTHVLVIPKKHITSLLELAADDEALMGRLVGASRDLARELGLAEGGFRLVFNCGEDAGYSVFHIHLHLLGGRPLGWPPG